MIIPENELVLSPIVLDHITSGGGDLPELDNPASPDKVLQGYDYINGEGTRNVGAGVTQEITAELTSEEQTIEPQQGYLGISSITIQGYNSILTDAVSVTPTEQTQIISPDDGDAGIKSVTVEPIPAEYFTATVENETLILSRVSVQGEELII